jgi:hypothetical protein
MASGSLMFRPKSGELDGSTRMKFAYPDSVQQWRFVLVVQLTTDQTWPRELMLQVFRNDSRNFCMVTWLETR